MMTRGSRYARLALATILAAGMAKGPVWAQDAPAESRQFKSAVDTIVEDAKGLIETWQSAAAIPKLNAALNTDLNHYEQSAIYQMLGSAYYQLDEYDQAISSFEKAISAGGLAPKENTELRLNIAQLLIANGQNRDGAAMLEDYLKQGNPSKLAHVDMMVGACVQAEDYACALPWAEKWFEVADPKARKHYDLLIFLYNNLGLKDKQVGLIEKMLIQFPEDRALWDRLASLLSNSDREKEAFEIKKMLYLSGALTTEADLLMLVQYYSYYDMPFQGAQILEREMNAGRVSRETKTMVLLSDMYRQAREYERAVPILEEVADSVKSAVVYAQFGEAYYKTLQCAEAEAALKKAMAQGYDKGKAWMLVGSCFYEASADQKRADCDMTEAQISNAPKAKMLNQASAAFDKVPLGSSQWGAAIKWRKFIKSEAEASKHRCGIVCDIRDDLCFNDLANAYKARVFTGGKLVLNDPSCIEYKDTYDKIYISRPIVE